MLTGLLHLHSFLRWGIVIVAIFALLRFLIVALRSTSFSRLDQRLMPVLAWTLTVQFVLGLVLFITYLAQGLGFQPIHAEHAVIMLLAVGLSHMAGKWSSLPDPQRARRYLMLLGGIAVLVFVGVARLPQGWLG